VEPYTCSATFAGVHLAFQGTLLGAAEPAIDRSFRRSHRLELANGAWVDHVPGWLTGADELFGDVVDVVEWQSPMVRMWDKEMQQPRLNGSLAVADRPPIAEDMRAALSDRYDIEFRTIGANLYRDGRDSVAWHGDRVARTLPEATIAIVSLGGSRRFLLRPKGGGRSVRFELASGDLLAMGGTCQRTWQHSVPKVAHAEPRISLTFRHRYDD
jgi:alkylated DNA repair dioxygenase AlkB